ncbi:MAG: signal peptidase I [Thermoflexaceae bacterium]|nr:signal peptidase I [Thermoflexaceae bacterium]
MLLDQKKPDDFFEDTDDLEDLSSIKKALDEIDIPIETSNNKTSGENTEHSILKELFSYVKILCVAVILALLINNYVIVNASVPTGSMNNTIMEGDRLIGFRLSYLFSEPKRGDIIIFKYPDDTSQKFVKRIIGLPGDIVEIKREENGVNVYVNGVILNEPYLKEEMRSVQDYLFIVPNDSYFVMGDNRNDSKDSRFWENTYVPKDYIIAKAIFKYYSKFEVLSTPHYY